MSFVRNVFCTKCPVSFLYQLSVYEMSVFWLLYEMSFVRIVAVPSVRYPPRIEYYLCLQTLDVSEDPWRVFEFFRHCATFFRKFFVSPKCSTSVFPVFHLPKRCFSSLEVPIFGLFGVVRLIQDFFITLRIFDVFITRKAFSEALSDIFVTLKVMKVS